ncbi:MAG: hypothetical protein GXP53_07575, partial [Deltaproteobacteria bacterium]|nr:hypothetical protein [Deltaproteobacteria bacterium]
MEIQGQGIPLCSSGRRASYFISGSILSTQYKGKLFSYGLSVYGPVLWFIGFPATTIQNELSVEMALF